jgi:carbon-monoxide dehydrogenase large subunit
MAARKVKAKARQLAAHLLSVHEDDVEWELGRFHIRGVPERGVTIQECAMGAYANMPDGLEPGLENAAHYDPPNLIWPFACYLVTVEVDAATGVWEVLRVVAVDDHGVRINPKIVETQIMAGLTEAYAMASMQQLTFDSDGHMIGNTLSDYLVPTAWETPGFELHEVATPCPHHPIGSKGNGEAATGAGPAAFVNAVLNALQGSGVRNIDMPLLTDRVWEAANTGRDVTGAPPSRTWDWAPESPAVELVVPGAAAAG